MDLGYARVATVKQDLERQVDALMAAGIPEKLIYLDKKSGATTDRPGLRAALAYARSGDVIVVHTLEVEPVPAPAGAAGRAGDGRRAGSGGPGPGRGGACWCGCWCGQGGWRWLSRESGW